MPKVSKTQPSFTTGMISKSVWGRIDDPKYESALAVCQNYLPLIQGALVRRPGTRFVANVKDPSKPPILVPFLVSATNNYMLEFGDKYVRFYQNEAQITANSTYCQVVGQYGPGVVGSTNYQINPFRFTGIRPTSIPGFDEFISTSSVISKGSVMELQTDYSFGDLTKLKWTQKQDTMYLTHPNYPVKKLQRTGQFTFDLKDVGFQDGPYLPLNSYTTIADNANQTFALAGSVNNPVIATQPILSLWGVSADPNSAFSILNMSASSTFNIGDKVCVHSASGATFLNNANGANQVVTNSSAGSEYWTVIGNTTPQLQPIINCPFNAAVLTNSSGQVQPAIFQLTQVANSTVMWADFISGSSQPGIIGNGAQRPIGLIQNGIRYYGWLAQVTHAGQATVIMAPGQQLATNSGTITFWQMGAYNQINGFPSTCCFHQDRLVLAGQKGNPQELDMSMTSLYEVFSLSGSSLQVSNNNAIQFSLNSQDTNAIKWIRSSTLALLAGTFAGEWSVAPSTQSAGITPTNVSATQFANYGSYDTDAIQVGQSVIYIQRAQRKVREIIYYWQVGNYRSTNLSEWAEFLTLPTVTKLVTQREVHPQVWAIRSDGILLSAAYNREDISNLTRVGWAQHVLGGQSDSAGTPPIVQSMAVIPSGDSTFEELWLLTKRYINGSNAMTIEYLSKNYDDSQSQELSYHLDCGFTYNSSIPVSSVLIGSACILTAANHGISNSTFVRFYNTVGINQTSYDQNGNATIINALNETVFIVCSSQTNTFGIADFTGKPLNTNSCSVYVGSCVVNVLGSSVTASWLANETVSILADGIFVGTSVASNTGVITLSNPAAIVSVGYPYNSDGQLLRTKDGSAQGTSIGSNRRVNRVAFMLHDVGDFSFGPTFTQLIPCKFNQSDQNQADTMIPLFDGIHRDSVESGNDQFTDSICFRQSSPLPGMVQAVTRFLEENDV